MNDCNFVAVTYWSAMSPTTATECDLLCMPLIVVDSSSQHIADTAFNLNLKK